MPLLARRRAPERGTTIPGMGNAAEARQAIGDGAATTEGGARTVGLTKVYGTGTTAVRALDDVTVEFPAGRFTAIMGPSGAASPP